MSVCASSIVCLTGRVHSAVTRDVTLVVSDTSRTTCVVDIRGTATTADHDSFAYKARLLVTASNNS